MLYSGKNYTTVLVDGFLPEQGLVGCISKHVCDYFLCMVCFKALKII